MSNHVVKVPQRAETQQGVIRAVRKVALYDGDRKVCESERQSETMRAHPRVSHGATIGVRNGVITWRTDLDGGRGAWLYEPAECA